MPKPRPPYSQGNYYHFYNRGSHKQAIYHDPRDYTYLLYYNNNLPINMDDDLFS